MIKSKRYEDDIDRHTIEFLDESDRDVAFSRLEAWNRKILDLFEIGHELVMNGREVEKYGEAGAVVSQTRVAAGYAIIDWASCLLMGRQDEELIDGLRVVVEKYKRRNFGMDDMKGKINSSNGHQTTYVFTSEDEAIAFSRGIDLANDGTFKVSSITEDAEGDMIVIVDMIEKSGSGGE